MTDRFVVAVGDLRSSGIRGWAAGFEFVRKAWVGEPGTELVGWVRPDGARAIETNGDPVFEEDAFEYFSFDEVWDARTFALSELEERREAALEPCPAYP